MKVWTVLELKEFGDYKNAEVVGVFSTEKLAVEQIERIYYEVKNRDRVNGMVSYIDNPRHYEFETDTGKRYGFIIEELTLDEFV
jgi:hypothetical protein